MIKWRHCGRRRRRRRLIVAMMSCFLCKSERLTVAADGKFWMLADDETAQTLKNEKVWTSVWDGVGVEGRSSRGRWRFWFRFSGQVDSRVVLGSRQTCCRLRGDAGTFDPQNRQKQENQTKYTWKHLDLRQPTECEAAE